MSENQVTELTNREKFWLGLDADDPKSLANRKDPYVSIRIAAEKTRRHTATVNRAVANNELEVKFDGKQKFVSIRSLINWIGKETAKAYGLLPADGR